MLLAWLRRFVDDVAHMCCALFAHRCGGPCNIVEYHLYCYSWQVEILVSADDSAVEASTLGAVEASTTLYDERASSAGGCDPDGCEAALTRVSLQLTTAFREEMQLVLGVFTVFRALCLQTACY